MRILIPYRRLLVYIKESTLEALNDFETALNDYQFNGPQDEIDKKCIDALQGIEYSVFGNTAVMSSIETRAKGINNLYAHNFIKFERETLEAQRNEKEELLYDLFSVELASRLNINQLNGLFQKRIDSVNTKSIQKFFNNASKLAKLPTTEELKELVGFERQEIFSNYEK